MRIDEILESGEHGITHEEDHTEDRRLIRFSINGHRAATLSQHRTATGEWDEPVIEWPDSRGDQPAEHASFMASVLMWARAIAITWHPKRASR